MSVRIFLSNEEGSSLCPFTNVSSCMRRLPFVAWMKPMSHESTGWMLECTFIIVFEAIWLVRLYLT